MPTSGVHQEVVGVGVQLPPLSSDVSQSSLVRSQLAKPGAQTLSGHSPEQPHNATACAGGVASAPHAPQLSGRSRYTSHPGRVQLALPNSHSGSPSPSPSPPAPAFDAPAPAAPPAPASSGVSPPRPPESRRPAEL